MGQMMDTATDMDEKTRNVFKQILVAVSELTLSERGSLKRLLKDAIALVTDPAKSIAEGEYEIAAARFINRIFMLLGQSTVLTLRAIMESVGIAGAALTDVYKLMRTLADAIAKKSQPAATVTDSHMITSGSNKVKESLYGATVEAILNALSRLTTDENGSILAILNEASSILDDTKTHVLERKWEKSARTLLKTVGSTLLQGVLLGGNGLVEATGIASAFSRDVYRSVRDLADKIVRTAPVGPEGGEDDPIFQIKEGDTDYNRSAKEIASK